MLEAALDALHAGTYVRLFGLTQLTRHGSGLTISQACQGHQPPSVALNGYRFMVQPIDLANQKMNTSRRPFRLLLPEEALPRTEAPLVQQERNEVRLAELLFAAVQRHMRAAAGAHGLPIPQEAGS